MKTLILAIVVALPLAAAAQQPSDQPVRHHRHHPPPEALAACQGKEAGAACSFSHKERTVEGTCFTPASDKPLACRPVRAPAAPPPPAQ